MRRLYEAFHAREIEFAADSVLQVVPAPRALVPRQADGGAAPSREPGSRLVPSGTVDEPEVG